MDYSLDILLHIVVHLPLESVLRLCRTCKTIYALTRLRSLWMLLFRQHVLERQIPYPNGVNLEDMSVPEFESLIRRTLTLRRNWTSPSPVPRRQLTFDTPSEPSARIIFLQFLPGRSSRWLISVRMTDRPRMYLLQCWDLSTAKPRCIAELRHADGPYGGVALNSDPNSPAVLALQSAQTETFSIHFDATDPECAFVTEAVIDGIRELHLLSGDILVTRRIDDGALSLWDLSDLTQEKLHLLNPSLIQPDDRVQAIHLAHDYALVVRFQSIEIYSTTPRQSILPVHGAPIAYPLAQFKFQWRTDAVVLCEQHSSSSLPSPIHLFVRFGSIYPWPVNILHHYLFRPNPSYTPPLPIPDHISSSPSSPSSSSSPTLPSPSSPTYLPTATTEYNLPYDIRPCLIHTINSPIRLFCQSAMAFGRYGTALWLDNHSEEWWSGPSERGQRLAGTVLVNGSGNANENKEPEPMTAGADPVSVTSKDASMVFGFRDDDTWTRLAMDEETGRITIGHVDGAITLLEY